MKFEEVIVGGTTLVIPAIQSPDYDPGVSGWQVNIDGSAEFNNVQVRGDLITGTSTDYVKVSAAPSPHVEFMSSAVAVDAPGWLGFEDNGSDTFKLEAPAFTGSGVGSTISFDPSGALFDVVNGNLDLATVIGEIRMRSATIRMGGNSAPNQVILDPNNNTIVAYGMDRGRGLENYVNVTASTALSASETIGITSGTVNFEVGRAYEITLHYQGSGNTANDQVGFRLRRSTVGGNSLFDSLRTNTLKAASDIVNGETTQIVTPSSAISTVIVGTVYRATGAGTVQWFANAANPTWIRIKDVGLATDYPGAKIL